MLFFMLPSEHQGNTYAISIATFLKHRHFQKETHAALFLQTVLRYRDQGKFQLHGFAIMPDHIHMLITTTVDQALPKCVQLIKGGYSFAARKITQKEIWQHGYYDHKVSDLVDYGNQLRYIANNPPAGRLPEDYFYVHTHAAHESFLDPCPFCVDESRRLG
jgi:putative transposase